MGKYQEDESPTGPEGDVRLLSALRNRAVTSGTRYIVVSSSVELLVIHEVFLSYG